MVENIDTPIFITGCARSGTSLTAGIISKCGAWGGHITGATPYNQRGQFENTELRNRVIKGYLRSKGVDPLGQNPLPDIDKVWEDAGREEFITQWREEVISIIRKQGYDGSLPWYYKGAKMCLIFPLWHKAFPEAKWVIVRRDDYDICSSCLKTPFMRGFNKRNGWMVWVTQHKKRFEEMKKAGLNIIEYWPFGAVDGKLYETRVLIDSLGLPYNREEIVDFISPNLWHHKEEGGIK